MEKVYLYVLPGQQFHFGGYSSFETNVLEECDTHIHSDLLFSAIVDLCSQVYPDFVESLISGFKKDEIKISSAFWFIKKENKEICFYPKPSSCDLFRTNYFKKYKKVKYISERIIEQGITPDRWLEECFMEGTFLATREELNKIGIKSMPRLYDSVTSQKVRVHTDTVEDNLFLQTNIQVNDPGYPEISTGFWFYLDTPSSESKSNSVIMSLIRILADRGIGGQRSTGTGKIYKVSKHDSMDLKIIPGEPVLTLGLLSPDESETDNLLYYSLLTRGGRYSAAGQRLRLLNILEEGAILIGPTEGNIINLKPENTTPSLRYGKPLNISINKKFIPKWS